MPKKRSAGLLLFREVAGDPQVLLVHPGGPLWAKKDAGAWSIPKGEIEDGEDPLEAARREFKEETGAAAPDGGFVALSPVRQPSGKTVHAWAVRGEFDVAALKSNLFPMEWPPKSGQRQEFPEVDRAAWLPLAQAKRKISPGQRPLLEQFQARCARRALAGPAATGPGKRGPTGARGESS